MKTVFFLDCQIVENSQFLKLQRNRDPRVRVWEVVEIRHVMAPYNFNRPPSIIFDFPWKMPHLAVRVGTRSRESICPNNKYKKSYCICILILCTYVLKLTEIK